MRRAEVDAGQRSGLTTQERERVRELKREVRETERPNPPCGQRTLETGLHRIGVRSDQISVDEGVSASLLAWRTARAG